VNGERGDSAESTEENVFPYTTENSRCKKTFLFGRLEDK
jgi:hypothetical protein